MKRRRTAKIFHISFQINVQGLKKKKVSRSSRVLLVCEFAIDFRSAWRLLVVGRLWVE
jgi:hypothetical protein